MDAEVDSEESCVEDVNKLNGEKPDHAHASSENKAHGHHYHNSVSRNGYLDFEKEFLQFSKSKTERVNFSSRGNNQQSAKMPRPCKPHRKSPYSVFSGMVLKKYRKQRKNLLAGLRKNVRFVFNNEAIGINSKDGFKSRHSQSVNDLSTSNCVLDSTDHVCSDLSMSEMGSELSGNRGNGYSPFNSSNSCGSPECNVNCTSENRHIVVHNHTDVSSIDSQDDSQDGEHLKYQCLQEQNNNEETTEDCACQKQPHSPKSQNSSDTEDYIDVVSVGSDNNIVDIEMVLDQQVNTQHSKPADKKKQLSIDTALANLTSPDECFSLPNSSHLSTKGKTLVSPVKWQQQFMSFLSTSVTHEQNEPCMKSPSSHSGRKKRSRRVRHSVCACCLGGSPSHGKRKRHHSEGDISFPRKRHSASGTHKRFIRDMVQLVSLRNKIMKLLRVLFPNNLEIESIMNCDTEKVDELIDDVIDILRSPDYGDDSVKSKDTLLMESCDIKGDKSCESPPDVLDCPPLVNLAESLVSDENEERDDDEMPVLSMIDYKSEFVGSVEEVSLSKQKKGTGICGDQISCPKFCEKDDSSPHVDPPDDLTELDNALYKFLSGVESPERSKDVTEDNEHVSSTRTVTSEPSHSSDHQISDSSEQNRKISVADSAIGSTSEIENSLCVPCEHQRNVSEADSVMCYEQSDETGTSNDNHIRTVSEADSGIGYDPDLSSQNSEIQNNVQNSICDVEELSYSETKLKCVNSQIIDKSIEEVETGVLQVDELQDLGNLDRRDSLTDANETCGEVSSCHIGHSKEDSKQMFLSELASSDVSSPLMVRTDDPFLNNEKICPATPLNKSAISCPDSTAGTPLDKLKIQENSVMNHLDDTFDIDQSNELYYPTLCHEMASSLSSENSKSDPKIIEVFDVGVVLCKKPKICLKALKKRLYVLLRWLLPRLQFRNYFFKNTDNLEYLLDTLTSCNEPNKIVQESPVQV